MTAKTDTERLQQDVLRAYKHVALQRIRGEKDPDYVDLSTIEPNGTKRKKTIRLLNQYKYLGLQKTDTSKSYYRTRTYKKHQILHFEEESKDLASREVYRTTWKQLYEKVTTPYLSRSDHMENVGYEDINRLSPSAVLDYYWHPEDYDVQERDSSIDIYPKEHLTQRCISILRCLVEYEYNERYVRVLEKRAGLPEGSLPKESKITYTVRNFAHTPRDFNEHAYHGEGGYLPELDHHIAYLKALRSRLCKCVQAARDAGGYDILARQYRQAAMKDLLEDAPLRMNTGERDSAGDYIRDSGTIPLGARYILKHADLFDYETLYADGEEALYIHDGFIQDEPYKPHVPEEGQLSLIKAEAETTTLDPDRKRKAACILKMISEVSPNT